MVTVFLIVLASAGATENLDSSLSCRSSIPKEDQWLNVDSQKAMPKLQPYMEYAPKVLPCKMTKLEWASIQYYTGSGYQSMNRSLRSCEGVESVLPMARFVFRALARLEPFEGEVRRGVTLYESARRNVLRPGVWYSDKGFLSTSFGREFSGNVNFRIQSKSCKRINVISAVKQEREVLCLPGTEFRIVQASEEHDFRGKSVRMVEIGTPPATLEQFTEGIVQKCKRMRERSIPKIVEFGEASR